MPVPKISSPGRKEALTKLREWFPKGSTVYTILRSVSRSGMQRTLSVVALPIYRPSVENRVEDRQDEIIPLFPDYYTSLVTGYSLSRGGVGHIIVKGYGSDAGMEVAHALGYYLYGDEFALKHRWL